MTTVLSCASLASPALCRFRTPYARRNVASGTKPAHKWGDGCRAPPRSSRAKESAMRDMTDPGIIDRADVGQTNGRSTERKSGVGGWLGFGIGLWSVVILVAIVFAVAIIVFATQHRGPDGPVPD